MLEHVPTLAPRCLYEIGDIVFRRGDPGVRLYEVVRGAVRLVGRREDGSPGEVALLGVGALVGLDALNGGPHRVHAVAHAPVVELRPVDPLDLDHTWLRDALLDRLRAAEQRALDLGGDLQARIRRFEGSPRLARG